MRFAAINASRTIEKSDARDQQAGDQQRDAGEQPDADCELEVAVAQVATKDPIRHEQEDRRETPRQHR